MFVALGAKDVQIIEEDDTWKLQDADVYINFANLNKLTDQKLWSLAEDPVILTMELSVMQKMFESKRPDAIMLSGGKFLDHLILPYMTKAVLQTESTEINMAMKIAAAEQLFQINNCIDLAPDADAEEREKIMHTITDAISKAAIESGVARNNSVNADHLVNDLMKI